MHIYIMIHGHNYNKSELYHSKNPTDLNWVPFRLKTYNVKPQISSVHKY